MPPAPTIETERCMREAARLAERSGVFASVACDGKSVTCRARAAAAPASYRLSWDAGTLWVSLVMADRWLSESIEADLMHTGDHIEDLVEEELVDLGVNVGRLPVEHFRSDDLLFTFRSPVPTPPGEDWAPVAGGCLLAYEACFRNLGDMSATEKDG